jgi:YD repeat-containing protein
MTDDMTITLDGEEYALRRDGDGLRVGRRVAGDVTWLDTVDLGLLPTPAREALDRGDTSDVSLQNALLGVTTAEAERGG